MILCAGFHLVHFYSSQQSIIIHVATKQMFPKLSKFDSSSFCIWTDNLLGVHLNPFLQESGSNQVVFMQLDLGSLKSVRSFAENFLKAEPRLDILINNAG